MSKLSKMLVQSRTSTPSTVPSASPQSIPKNTGAYRMSDAFKKERERFNKSVTLLADKLNLDAHITWDFGWETLKGELRHDGRIAAFNQDLTDLTWVQLSPRGEGWSSPTYSIMVRSHSALMGALDKELAKEVFLPYRVLPLQLKGEPTQYSAEHYAEMLPYPLSQNICHMRRNSKRDTVGYSLSDALKRIAEILFPDEVSNYTRDPKPAAALERAGKATARAQARLAAISKP